MNWLTNEWMNNPTFLAQAAHFFGAYAVCISAFAIWNLSAAKKTAIIFASCALLKEFIYDANFEMPTQKFLDNLLDFSFYCIGLIVALAISNYLSCHKKNVA